MAGRASTSIAVAAIVLSFVANASSAFVCSASGSASLYNATSKYLGCYLDPKVSILGQVKVSTIAMTPQYCANFCGVRGYAYGGVEFGTQCFCGNKPDLTQATKTGDKNCSSVCATEPSSSCGGGYVMSLYQINNPEGTAPTGLDLPENPPACQTYPLCSQQICNTSLTIAERVTSLVNTMSKDEKILNLVDSAAGSTRLGLPAYEWWSEATHGVGSAPGVQFPQAPGDFSHATSFPAPILTAATFDTELMKAIGTVVGTEGRAFGNYGFSGFDFWAPNMNPFRDPRWGRGQETPGEDVFVVQSYIRQYVAGLQGTDLNDKLVISTCKHYAAYDLETGRTGNDYNPDQQDLADYFLAPFKTCVRDTDVGSVMCSYNAVNGVPTCASQYLLQDILRDYWNFTQDYNYVVSDCSAVTDIWHYHNFTTTEEGAATVALNAGVDLECGSSFLKLNVSLADKHVNMTRMDQALTRLYTALFTVGYFDGSQYSNLGWADVATANSTSLAYQAAVEGMTLLKNNGLLPLSKTAYKSVAVIGPYANATTQMQGDYSGMAPHLISPLMAFRNRTGWTVNYAAGTGINTPQNTSGFAAAMSAAQKSDLIIYCGGIDNSIEAEGLDRLNLTWTGNQLSLVSQLAKLSKPFIVAQFGGGQLDDSSLLKNNNVSALVWAGYPSQEGGTALVDLLTGNQSFAGRLPITQYSADYANEVNIFDINLRPNGSYPGRTYKYYTGTPVLPFGYGLHYTNFTFDWMSTLNTTYDIGSLVSAAQAQTGGVLNDQGPVGNVSISVNNTGAYQSDYSGLLFISSPDAGPAPRPVKSLVAFSRLHNLAPGAQAQLNLPLTLGSMARANQNGDLTIFPGNYTLALDIDSSLMYNFSLTGSPTVIESLPLPKASYSYAVPVHYQPASNSTHGSG